MAERAALHGGRLKAGPGEHGFTVRLRVPSPAACGSPPMPPADPARHIRVLVADDQKVVRDGIASLLGLLPGIEVAGTAADGTEAVRLALAPR